MVRFEGVDCRRSADGEIYTQGHFEHELIGLHMDRRCVTDIACFYVFPHCVIRISARTMIPMFLGHGWHGQDGGVA